MNERAIMLLTKLLSYCDDVPRSNQSQHKAVENAASRLALEEILTQVWDHPQTLASDIIERFALKMETYEAAAVTDDQKRIFSVAAKSAWGLHEMVIELEK